MSCAIVAEGVSSNGNPSLKLAALECSELLHQSSVIFYRRLNAERSRVNVSEGEVQVCVLVLVN